MSLWGRCLAELQSIGSGSPFELTEYRNFVRTKFTKRQGRCWSLWREDQFMLHLLQSAVNPKLSLRDCLEDWPAISTALREPPRTHPSDRGNGAPLILALMGQRPGT